MTFSEEIEAAIAAFMTGQRLDRADALQHILRDWLCANGYLGHGDEGTRPEELNATNDD